MAAKDSGNLMLTGVIEGWENPSRTGLVRHEDSQPTKHQDKVEAKIKLLKDQYESS